MSNPNEIELTFVDPAGACIDTFLPVAKHPIRLRTPDGDFVAKEVKLKTVAYEGSVFTVRFEASEEPQDLPTEFQTTEALDTWKMVADLPECCRYKCGSCGRRVQASVMAGGPAMLPECGCSLWHGTGWLVDS